MKAKVAIYATNQVRGQIIAKTLSVCGIRTDIVEDPDAAVREDIQVLRETLTARVRAWETAAEQGSSEDGG